MGNAPWAQAAVQILCCHKGEKQRAKLLVHSGPGGGGVVAAGVGYIR